MRDLPPSAVHPEMGGGQDVFYPWAVTVPRPLITKAKGIHLWDNQGREYIDLSSGPVVSNIGHGNEVVADVMSRQARTVDFASSRHARNEPNMDLAARIAELAGPGFERVCFSSGGSEAVECAIKFLRQYAVSTGQPKRRKLITCNPSYHGATMATLAMSGDDELAPFLDGMVERSLKVPSPATYRLPPNHTEATYARHCADALEACIAEAGADNILGFFIEPVGGLATGCNVPPPDYFTRVREICTRYGIALVFDEVLCGTGRTGKFLAAHNWPDALPDIVVLAKGLGSGYTPLGATLIPARMADQLAAGPGFAFFHTYSANPISCATAMAVLDEYERLDVIRHAEVMGRYLREQLEGLKTTSAVVGDIRGLGLLMALEVVTDKVSKAVFPPEVPAVDLLKLAGLRNGLLIYGRRTAKGRNGDWIMVSPPMIITRAECDELMRRLTAALRDFEADAEAMGLVA
jgi:adenosylmethionine-8-amino-7-oxononanoate aminotransferase